MRVVFLLAACSRTNPFIVFYFKSIYLLHVLTRETFLSLYFRSGGMERIGQSFLKKSLWETLKVSHQVLDAFLLL